MSAASTPGPYVGTRPFDRKDSENFFGRDREADDLFSLVLARPVVLIYAASGAGKSSLLNAGLIPRLEERFQILGPVEVTGPVPPEVGEIKNIYWFHTLTKLNGDLSSSIATPSELASLSLMEFLRRLEEREPGRSRALLFDQFEKFFTANVAQNEQRRAFIEELAQALHAAPQLRVVFSMREEYIAQFEVFAYSLPDKLRTRMRLEPLRERAAVEAIRGPLERIGLFFEKAEKDSDNPAEALVHELLKIRVDIGPNKTREIIGEFVEPIQLQVVCQNMWRNFPDELKARAAEPQGLPREKKIITRDQVKTGNVDQALAEYYDHAIEDAACASGTSRRELRRWFGWTLITPAGMRGIALASSEETAQLPETALEVFLDQRLVRKESRGGSEWYELTHDRFIEPIQRSNRDWFEKRAESEAVLSKLEEKAKTAFALLDEKETREAEAFLASPAARVLGPSPQVESLVSASRRQVNKEAKQRQIKISLAWSTIAVLLLALLVSWYAVIRVSRERNHAKAAEERATVQKKMAQAEVLRARKQNFEDKSLIASMADRLLELSTPQEALFWHATKAGALSDIGMHEKSIQEYDLILQLDPENLRAKVARGSEHTTQREAEEALQDTDAYLQRVPTNWTARQNQGISLALLGRYDEAEKAIRDSIREFQFMGAEYGENEVAPDIRDATGHTTLRGSERSYQTANYYELANLKAYAGSEEFDAALTAAKKQPNSAEAALIALNWAWLHMDKRNEDYGALAAQGALWESAGFNDLAKKDYLDFGRLHKQTKDQRYEGLARWVANRLAALKTYEKTKTEEPGVEILELEAEERLAKGKMEEALERINRAIRMAPNDVTLYLSRAGISYRNKEYRECKWDCDRILSKAPNTPNAYVFRALANKKLIDTKEIKASPEIIENDLRKALEYNPDEGTAMELLSDALYERAEKEGFKISGRKLLDEALQLLERSISAGNLDFEEMPYIYYKKARVQCARGDFGQARASLETAIAMKDDDFDFYDLLATIERGIYGEVGETLVVKDLCEGYLQPADKQLRLGRKSKALGLYWVGIERLARLRKSKNERGLDDAIANTLSKISSVIEMTTSKAKVPEFWKTAIESGRWNEVQDLFENEERRLSTSR